MKGILVTIETNDILVWRLFTLIHSHRVQHDELRMSFQIGENCEGLHEGRWFACTILSHEGEEYKVTFENWSSRFDAILPSNGIRPRSLAIDCRSRKRQRPTVNFSKLFPEDGINVEVDGMKKPAIVKIIDPFLEILTVEMENEEVMVPFHCVLPRDEKPMSQPAKKRKEAVPKQASPQELLAPATTPSPTLPRLESSMTPQFFSVVRPDGVEISCGDLVTIAPICTDLAFIIIEIYQEDLREMMKAQKCEFSDGMVAKLDEQFNLTCPVTSVHKADSKISSKFTKTVQDIRRKAILRCADSQRQNAGNREYQLQVRKHELAAKLRGEIRKAMTTKAARNCTFKIGPANLATDLELLSLTLESGFRTTKSKNVLADFDPLLGSNWDVKKKPDDHFFYVTYAEFALDVSTRALITKIKFAESMCAFRQDSYLADTAADCC